MAKIIMEVDSRKVPFESIDLVDGKQIFTQYLDYMNFPFRCAHLQLYWNVAKDCLLQFFFIENKGPFIRR